MERVVERWWSDGGAMVECSGAGCVDGSESGSVMEGEGEQNRLRCQPLPGLRGKEGSNNTPPSPDPSLNPSIPSLGTAPKEIT